MTNIPKGYRDVLAETFTLASVREGALSGSIGRTQKILTYFDDGECVEMVLLPAGDRRTVCISCQVGCKFACAFCASGKAGFRRNLSAGEIVGQVVLAARRWGRRPDNVVFMGMGEPFDNYDAVLRAVRVLNDPECIGIGARRITISTSGVVPGIERLQREGLQVELSVSLHAPEDALRSRLMPVNQRYPLQALLRACKAYTAATKRIITFEYTLIAGVNDQPQQAEALGALLRGFPARVNLIPLSPVDEFDGRTPTRATVDAFQNILARARIHTTIRESKGADLDAACGQLRGRMLRHAAVSVARP
jgi:23S rRNA (adenine2503-C2)-methyltransferase